jgi:hypothetical protein
MTEPQFGLNPMRRPRRSNPHSARGSALRPPSAVSFLGGFRTPAAEYAALSLKRPASETLNNSGAKADTPEGPGRAKTSHASLRRLLAEGNPVETP